MSVRDFLDSFKSGVRFTISGNGVVHARASEIMKSERATRQLNELDKVIIFPSERARKPKD